MAIHGKNGAVKIGANDVAQVREFNIEETAETADNSVMGNSYRGHTNGLKSWSGSLSCFLDATDTNGQGSLTAGASVTLSLQPQGDISGDLKYTGTATITRINRKIPLDGNIEVSFDFQGNGALTEGTVT